MRQAIFLLLFLVSAVSAQETSKPLTNGDVIEMSRAALPPSVIVSKIKASRSDFKTDLESLKTLNAEKVPETVISAMIETTPAKTLDAVLLEPSSAPPAAVARTFTPYSQLTKSEQKQRLKNAAQIEIAAAADKTAAWLIKGFQSWNYQLESESPRSLLFGKEVPGIGNKMLVGMALGGDNLRYKIQVSLSETGGLTSVIVNLTMTSQNAFGKTRSQSVDHNKKARAELDELLLKVKNYAEGEAAKK